jgi:NitT/TauT family transport system substrate-binding protein
MNILQKGLTRRHVVAGASAGVMAAGLGLRPASAALETVRQGYQTNMWGMPTYYLLRSGLLEKHGVKFEEFAVPGCGLITITRSARYTASATLCVT